MSLLDELLSSFDALPPAEREFAVKAAVEQTKNLIWLPSPGPQTEAYFHPADILLYGGQAGGGKTDLSVGLAFTAHERSLLLRRKYSDLSGLTDRAKQINGGKKGYNGSPPPRLTFDREGRECIIDFVGNQRLGDEQDQQGKPYDLKCFDEATQFLEAQIRFHIGWLRSTTPGQRCRIIMATNPPIDSNGDWIIGYYRPWLDMTHPNPAKHGELRWFVSDPDGKDVEVPGPEPYQFPGEERPVSPMSRTFIPARLSDNPYLVNTDYAKKLDGLPEPLRSAVRDGNFMASREDADNQVIPTDWIVAAQMRWKPERPEGAAMVCIAADIAQGGADTTTIAARFGGYYPELVTRPGSETPDGASVVALITKYRKDGATIVIDGGGGYGGAASERLKDNDVDHVVYKGAEGSAKLDRAGVLGFFNKRAESYWTLREELDPEQEGGSPIALPPDPEIRTQLTAPTFTVVTQAGRSVIKITPKEDVKKALGKSPDKADAIVMALAVGKRSELRQKRRRKFGDQPSRQNVGHSAVKRFFGRN